MTSRKAKYATGLILLSFAYLLGIVLLVQIAHEPAPGIELHHAVVRQINPSPFGWTMLCEPEVGGRIEVPTLKWHEPGTTLYIGAGPQGWQERMRPE